MAVGSGPWAIAQQPTAALQPDSLGPPTAWIPGLDVLAPQGGGGALRLIPVAGSEPTAAVRVVAENSSEGSEELEFALFRLADGAAADDEATCREVPAERVPALLARLGDPLPVWSGRVTVDGAVRALRGGELVQYVRTIHSEVVDGTAAALPVRDLVVDGTVATLGARSTPIPGVVTVAMALRRTDVLWPMRSERTPRGNLQLPAVRTERFVFAAVVRPGAGLVFGGGGDEASRWLLLLRDRSPRIDAAPALETVPARAAGGCLEVVFGTLHPGRPSVDPLGGPQSVVELRAVCGDPIVLPQHPDGGRLEAAFGIRQACIAGFAPRSGSGSAPVVDPEVGSIWSGVSLAVVFGPAADGTVPLELGLEIAWPSTERRGGLASGIDGLGTLELPQRDVARVRVETSLRFGGDWELLEIVEVGDAVGRLVVLGRLRE